MSSSMSSSHRSSIGLANDPEGDGVVDDDEPWVDTIEDLIFNFQMTHLNNSLATYQKWFFKVVFIIEFLNVFFFGKNHTLFQKHIAY